METYMREQMTEDIVRKATELYQFQRDNISFLGGFENFVYDVKHNNKEYILRFVHNKHRPYHQVLAEIEFIDYLSHNGACVSTVIHSKDDNIVEQIKINQDHYFSVSVFEKAPGAYVNNEDEAPEFWEMFGREIGRLHRLTKSFTPMHRRNEWHEEIFQELADQYLEDDDQQISSLFQSLSAEIKRFPKHQENYGLIHNDLHFHNMYYHEGSLTFFDFDDSAYMHFISDIAIVLYYYFQHLVIGENKVTYDNYHRQVTDVLIPFMKGYQTENVLPKEEMFRLNTFLRYRAVILYIVLVAYGYKHHEDERYRKFCEDSKKRALENSFELDLETLVQEIS